MLNLNYTYYLDLQEYKVKLPTELPTDSKKAINILRDNGYKGFNGSRGAAEQSIIKKEINDLKYSIRHTMETDVEYGEMSIRLSSLRTKIKTITATNYPEWFL